MKARKLPSGSWNIRITIKGETYSFTDSDRKTVMRQASAFAAECRENVQNPPLYKCLEDFITERSETLSPSTLRAYESIVRAIRKRNPMIAQKRVVVLTDKDIQTIIREISSPKTQKNYINLIQSATGRKFSPTFRKKLPKEVAVPSDLEVLGLIRLFEWSEMEIPVLLGAYAGLRRGEICALTIQDLDGDYIHINKDMVLDDFGQWVVKEPKTPSSNRTVLLPHHVAERIRKRGHITNLHPNIITKRFISKQEQLGIDPPYTFHSLRHFFASYLHAQNIPDAYVLRAGGWATPHVMQKVYRHALDNVHLEYEQKAVSAFQIPFQDKYPQT